MPTNIYFKSNTIAPVNSSWSTFANSCFLSSSTSKFLATLFVMFLFVCLMLPLYKHYSHATFIMNFEQFVQDNSRTNQS